MGGAGYSTSRGGGGDLATFSHTQNPVIEIYQCNLFIKYDINRYKESFFVVSFFFFQFLTMNFNTAFHGLGYPKITGLFLILLVMSLGTGSFEKSHSKLAKTC